MSRRMHNFDQFATPYDYRKVPMPNRVARPTASIGCLGIILFVLFGYCVSVLWWSLFLMIGVHASHAETWSYWYTVTHWGALTPFVAG